MAILKVQGPLNAVGGAGIQTAAKAYTSNVTAGNFLVAVCFALSSSGGAATVSDSLNGAWTAYPAWTEGANGNMSGGIFYKANTAGGACTVTLSLGLTGGGDDFPDLTIYEFSGVATASLTDGSVTASGTSAAPASGSITTTNANDLLIAGAGTIGASAISGGTAGWTGAVTTSGNWTQYQIVSSTAAYNATFTQPSAQWLASIAAFKATGGTTQKITATIAASAAMSGGVKKLVKTSITI